MARDRFSIYTLPPETVPAAPYAGPTLYGDTFDPNNPMPGQPGYGVVADAPIRQQRVEDAQLAQMVAGESPGARELNRRLREARHAEEELGYSPLAMGMNAVPFSDEILGGASALLDDNGLTYDEAQRAFSDTRNAQSANNPWSTRIGALGQMAITAPVPIAGEVSEFTMPGVLRAAAPTAAVGTAGGLAAGFAGSRPGHRLRDTLEGGLVGGATGTVAGLGGALGQGLRLSAASPDVGNVGAFARRTGAGAVEGLGYAAAATPDMMPGRIYDTQSALDTFERVAPYAAGMGAAIAPTAEAVSIPFRMARDIARRPVRDFEMPGTVRPEYDEALADVVGSVPDDDLAAVIPERVDLSTSADRARADIARQRAGGGVLENATRLGLRQDPYEARLQSLGLAGRDIERAAAPFGGPENLVNAARDIGLLRERSVYDPADELAAIARTRDEAGQAVQDYYRQLRESGATVQGGTIADEIEAIADRFGSIDDPRARAQATALRDQARMYRYGDEPVIEGQLPEERQISADQLLGNLRYRGRRNQEIWRTQEERQRPEQQAMLDVQRAEIGARNRLAEAELDPADYARYTDALQRYRVGRALAGPSGETPMIDRRQWGNMRAWMGAGPGAAAMRTVPGFDNPLGSAIGAAGGFVASRLGSRYQPSIMATINEMGGASTMPQVLQSSARALLESIRAGGAAATADNPSLAVVASIAERAPRSEAEIATGLEALRTAARTSGLPEAARAIQPAEAQAEWPALLRGIDRLARTAPERLGQFGDILSDASRRGTLPVVIQQLARTDPQALARIQYELAQEVAAARAGADRSDDEQRAVDESNAELRRLVPELNAAEPEAPQPGHEDEQSAIDESNAELLRMLGRSR